MFLMSNGLDFASWLEAEIQSRGWSQAELAKRARLNRAIVNKVLNRYSKPSPETLQAIARALGYPQEFVFRKAGLLDDSPTEEDALTRLLNHYFAQLTPQEQQIILTQIEALAQKRKHTTTPKRSKPSHASS